MSLLLPLFLATAVEQPVRTQIQVESIGQRDHRGELSAELARVQSELEELRKVIAAMPEGAAKTQEMSRLQEFEALVRGLNNRITDLPTAGELKSSPAHLSQAREPVPVTPIEIQPVEPVSSGSNLLFLGLGVLLGVLLASLTWPRVIEAGKTSPAPPGPGRLVVTAGLLSAVGLSLPSLGYAQDPILILWAALSAGLMIRLTGLSLGSQMQRILLDRSRPRKRSHEQARPTGSSDHKGSAEASPGDDT